jgi:hypothetical protein
MSRRPIHCSGAMYAGVPTGRPSWVVSKSVPASWRNFDTPKSRSFTVVVPPYSARKTFSGFRSRCTMPLACADASAERMLPITPQTSLVVIAVALARRSASVSPRSSSITMYGSERCTPVSITSTMFGCPMAAAALASRAKRFTASGCRA